MDKIRPDEVVNFFEYEKVSRRAAGVRDRAQAPAARLGGKVPLASSSRTARRCWFQIQEMCRAERIADDAKVREEIDVYNALLPGPRELSATLFIEIPEDMALYPAHPGRADGHRHRCNACGWQVGREVRGAR